MERKLRNVVFLGIGMMLVFSAFQTISNIEKTILDSIGQEDENFKGDGYTSMAIIYAVFAVFNWLAPSVISLGGPKIAMFYGAVTYLFFILTFLWPKTWLLYLASGIIGTGAAMIWTGQGNYLTLNSTPATISRNSGLFWALLQMSMFVGNLFVFFQFRGLTHIDVNTRTVVISVLGGIAAVGIVILVALPRTRIGSTDSVNVIEQQRGPVEALKSAANLFLTREMILLSVTFFYTGIELSFFSGVYSSAIGFTNAFGESAKQLVGLSGIFIGAGEVLGGALFGILGAKFTRWGRDPIVIGGFVFHLAAFFVIFLNLPNKSPFAPTDDEAFITSSAILAILCSFLLGFGDSCFNTQIYSMLGGVFAHDSASAFAIFKFTQSVAAAICFFYASALGLHAQLGILLFLSIIGTVTFVYVEWAENKKKKKMEPNEDESDSSVQTEKF
ncbi:UNC93-like protein MFSD11 isoform X1 [Photinus pyralis]|uniref:UNC93-like protein MFSD11 isoform X1 n=1 Tax=Photinus pyralis TaxID=7054 RepID=UPI00126732F0|nr:UNC93-like protein MFSD11 isoform X1 [Photinus pyralis]